MTRKSKTSKLPISPEPEDTMLVIVTTKGVIRADIKLKENDDNHFEADLFGIVNQHLGLRGNNFFAALGYLLEWIANIKDFKIMNMAFPLNG